MSKKGNLNPYNSITLQCLLSNSMRISIKDGQKIIITHWVKKKDCLIKWQVHGNCGVPGKIVSYG